MPVIGIFAGGNDIALPPQDQHFESRINTDVFTSNFVHFFDYLGGTKL